MSSLWRILQFSTPSLYGQNLAKSGPSEAFIKSFKNQTDDVLEGAGSIHNVLIKYIQFLCYKLFLKGCNNFFTII